LGYQPHHPPHHTHGKEPVIRRRLLMNNICAGRLPIPPPIQDGKTRYYGGCPKMRLRRPQAHPHLANPLFLVWPCIRRTPSYPSNQ
jgi:hypothetical protein